MFKAFVVSTLLGVGSIALAAPPTTQPQARPQDDYQRKMDEVNRRAREKAEVNEKSDIVRLREENAKLRIALESLAQTFQKDGLWSGPTDADGLLALTQRDPNVIERTRKVDDAAIKHGELPGTSIAMAITGRTLVKADVSAGDKGDYILFEFSVGNDGHRDVNAVKGTIEFHDKFGDSIGVIDVKINHSLAAGRSTQVAVRYEYNQFKDDDRALLQADTEGMLTIFKPTQIFFADGSDWRAPS